MPEIAISIVTKGDPITVDTRKILQALSFMGFSTHLVGLDWADSTEWLDVIDPLRVVGGRHSTSGGQWQDETYMVRRYDLDGTWIRDYAGAERDMEVIA